MPLFETLLGNSQVKQILTHLSTAERLPQTLLFYGTEGVGKKLFALEWARSLLATAKSQPSDLWYFAPEGKGSLITVEQAQKIGQEAQKLPFDAPTKWMIIDQVDRLHLAAANALLKVLEEPLATTHFILISSKKDQVLPTILSRCFPLYFRPLSDQQIIDYLVEKKALPRERAQNIATIAEGSLGDALFLAEGVDLRPHIAHLLRSDPLTRSQQAKILEEVCTQEGQLNRLRLDLLLREIAQYFIDLNLSHGKQALYFSSEELAWKGPVPSLDKIFARLQSVRQGIDQNIKLHHLLEIF